MANDSGQVAFFAATALEKTAERYPQKPAIIHKQQAIAFAALKARVDALAGHLAHEGIGAGDRVGILLPNSTAIPLSYYAIQRVAAVAVILDARLRGKELQGVLRDADLKLLIVHNQFVADAREIFKVISPVPLWVVESEDERSFEKRLALSSPPPHVQPRKAGDDALILYTSGTTGEPKGVVLTYRNLAQYPRVMSEMGITDSDTVRGCILPMSHIVGPIVCNELAQKGYTLVIFDQLNPISLLEGIQTHHLTVFEGVPIIFQLLLGVRNLADYDTSSVKIAAMMGTTVPVNLLRAFKSAQPHIKVIQGFGLTETSPLITLVEPQKSEIKMGSIGRAVAGAEVKIVDDDSNEVPPGEPGEIVTRGPHVMKGYFRKPQATAARIRDGWLHTDDVGRCDEDGYYYHLGRRDDMIITGGLNVYPAEVENMIYSHPGVSEALVFAIPDSKRGHVIGAAIVAKQDETVSEKDLLAFLRTNLANFKVPQKIVIRESLPRTASGKPIRDAQILLGS